MLIVHIIVYYFYAQDFFYHELCMFRTFWYLVYRVVVVRFVGDIRNKLHYWQLLFKVHIFCNLCDNYNNNNNNKISESILKYDNHGRLISMLTILFCDDNVLLLAHAQATGYRTKIFK